MKLFLMMATFALLGISSVPALNLSTLPDPLRTVTSKYLSIQENLADDSFADVTSDAAAINALVASDKTHAFPPEFQKAVGRLAASTDLHAARVAFEIVSDLFIKTLAQNKIKTGGLHAAYCPMIRATWVQTDPNEIQNPYYGPSMRCGYIQQDF